MPFHVLSLSGGGFLGYYTICVLAALEQRVGRPIGSCFDLISGTSVGGIVAICLANDVPAEAIKRAFEGHGQRIFSRRPVAHTRLAALVEQFRSLFRSKYDSRALRDTIGAVVGHDTTLAQLKRRILIPSVDLTASRAHFFKTPHRVDAIADAQVKATDVAMATSAAPTYFPIVDIGGKRYTDGSLYLNTPDVLAVHEAHRYLGVELDDIRLLSIGTTTSHFAFPSLARRNLGGLQWSLKDRMIRVIMAAQQATVDELITHQLGDRYLRIDEVKSPAQEQVLSLDVATNDAMKLLHEMAVASVATAGASAMLNEMLGYEAAKVGFVGE